MQKKVCIQNSLLLICAAVLIAVITQYPNVDKNLLKYVNYVAWVLTIVFMIFRSRILYISITMKELLEICVGGFIFEHLLFAIHVISEVSNYVTLTIIPIIVYFTVYDHALHNKNISDLRILLYIYCTSAVGMAIIISGQLFSNFSGWLSSTTYLYLGNTHKNSTGQILGCAIIVIFFTLNDRSKVKLIIKFLSLVLLVAALLYVQSRAVLLAVAIAILATLIIHGDLKKPILWFLVIVILCITAFNIDSVSTVVRHALLLDKYFQNGSLNLNQFSSNRLYYWGYYWKEFLQSPIVGVGNSYVDNLYICCLANGGIMFGGVLIAVFLHRISQNIKIYKSSDKFGIPSEIKKIFIAITIMYLVISFMEAYPPYGPGVACLLFWMLSGYFDGYTMTQVRKNAVSQTSTGELIYAK